MNAKENVHCTRTVMNVNENVYTNTNINVYGLITELSKHILQRYRPLHQNTQFTYDYDTKTIKRLRSKAFKILLKKADDVASDQGYTEYRELDPIVEIQKHAFVLRLGLRRAYDATSLEYLLEELKEFTFMETSVVSVLQLLVHLKDFNTDPEPLTNIFHYGNTNPAIPEITYNNSNNVPPFQVYPMECLILSDKFEATLDTCRLQIKQGTSTCIVKEIHVPHSIQKSTCIAGAESLDMPVAPGFMSTHLFDTVSSYSLMSSNRYFTKNLCLDADVLQDVAMFGDSEENEHIIPWERGLVTSYLYLPLTRTEATLTDIESCTDTWKSSDNSTIDESNTSMNNWNRIWNQIDVTDTSGFNYRTWECFGELEPQKESMFMTDVPMAALHLAKMKQMNSLPLLSGKVMNSMLLLEEVSTKEFLNDVKSMLLGIESNSFEYRYAVGFTLRKHISVYGVSSESLGETCQEAIYWGNCFKYLSYLVTPKLQSDKLPQEGLIFKAVCTNIKGLLLYYRAALLRIFTRENKSDGLLKMFHKVRPVAKLITTVAKLCEPYKERQCKLREGNSIITRIYNEAIKVTDTKVALVFYSLLKSCCDVYFRFLQKWMFEGICDDIYGEFMIKTQSQYLRNRGHKFWTESFSICKESVPGFLSDLAESILQCGKTVRLLRICDSKNPVCHVCVTEHPEIKVCLSVNTLHEQSLRCREYESKGKAALGPLLSLSTAILSEKQFEREMTEMIVRGQRDTFLRIREEREDALRKIAETKRELLTCLKEQVLMTQLQRSKVSGSGKESTNNMHSQIEHAKQGTVMRENSHVERTNILNYYEDLSSDIDKRCMRSQWRAKRMAFHGRRLNALTWSERELQDEQRVSGETYSMTNLDSVLATPIPFQDENKNYARPPDRALTGTTSDALTNVKSSTEISQAGFPENHSLLINCVQRITSNNNESRDIRNFLNNEGLEKLHAETSLNVMQNKIATTEALTTTTVNNSQLNTVTAVSYVNEESNDMLRNRAVCYKNRTSAMERPTFLNVSETDNMATKSQISQPYAHPLQYNMTPNNNELDVQEIRFPPCMNEPTKKNVGYSEDAAMNVNHGNHFGTPMSCTTDNFTWSIHSPTSQTLNMEERSPTEISNTDVSSSYHTITRSPVAIKEDTTFTDLFVLARNESTSLSVEADLTIADVEIIDHTSLQAYLERSIRIPLSVQSRLINNAVIKYFLKENNLLLHLHSLRSYFFLLNGEFAKSLTDSLFARLYEISTPIELFNSATLTNLLERALVNSFNSVYVNSELLSLSATDIPTQFHISDPRALDCLSLNYKINWPLNIILDDMVMRQYGKVFRFLITSGRVSWVLQEDFNIMKRERKAATSEQYHKLQLYRHSMTQFMNALHNYITCSVLHASWTEFEKDLASSLTVDQIYLSHINYIKRILSRCMLHARGEKVRLCLINIFKVILNFHNRLRSQSWISKSTGFVHPNFKKLEHMYRAFSELRAYMTHVAFKLATSGYQPHLMHFLNALNINHMYDLTVKTYRRSTAPSKL